MWLFVAIVIVAVSTALVVLSERSLKYSIAWKQYQTSRAALGFAWESPGFVTFGLRRHASREDVRRASEACGLKFWTDGKVEGTTESAMVFTGEYGGRTVKEYVWVFFDDAGAVRVQHTGYGRSGDFRDETVELESE